MVDFFRNQPIKRAYIFGSYVRGDNRPDSDIDILVELEKGTDLFIFIRIKQQLEKLINKTVDLISSNGLSPRIRPFIDKEKVLIYEK
ncbi:MAG: nucleotidyltransferase family protein [Bacteroidia bacterium]|nr:nucleotidyltransferase family protein [Bacteroidia bacterium]